MHAALCLLLLAAPFWETTPADKWSDMQVEEMLSNSPWAQPTTFRDGSPVVVYLATAKPVHDAENELLRRNIRKLPPGTARQEYQSFLAESHGKVIVVAIRNPNTNALGKADEAKHMEEASVLRAGKKKLKMTGHFPPAPSDPVLRLVFPKPDESVKELSFELYIPGAAGPYRQAVFRVKDLLFQGKPEM
ncbi:MAG: hypothetical protein HYZ37_19160 [Candidatus Solibacter usitatus]|nr:hypothetical protein [Candidatus Solibacter usitatus]